MATVKNATLLTAIVLRLVCCAWLLAIDIANAGPLIGVVVGISDGDTITVLDGSHRQHKVRLAGIDAPEKRQPFGQRSKQSLSELAYYKSVQAEGNKTDRYGRLLAKVTVAGRDINLEQVRRGLAWHYKAYQREQAPPDRNTYSDAEDAARAAHIGLWSIPGAVPPWEFRRAAKRDSQHSPKDESQHPL